MKTLKSLLAITLITTALAATNAFAVSPHWVDAASSVSAAPSADYAHSQTALGNAAKSKGAGAAVIATSAKSDPNLVACRQVGKAVCPVCGTAIPCSTSSAKMACCN